MYPGLRRRWADVARDTRMAYASAVQGTPGIDGADDAARLALRHIARGRHEHAQSTQDSAAPDAAAAGTDDVTATDVTAADGAAADATVKPPRPRPRTRRAAPIGAPSRARSMHRRGAPADLDPCPDKNPFAGAPSITETDAGHIQMVQASAADIQANTVEAHQSAAARVTAGSVNMSQGASGFVRGAEVHIEQGAVGAVAAEHVELREGFTLLVLARRVSGEATILLDWRGLVAAAALLLVLGRLLRGRG